MPDATYQPKVYNKQPGGTLVVASGGVIDVETGGRIFANGSGASAIVNLTDSTGGTADNTVADVTGTFSQSILNNNFADLIAKINGILNAIRGAGIIP